MADKGEDSASPSVSSDSMDEERPLKKARYIWQIKGRCRWKRPRPRSRSCTGTSNHSTNNHASCSLAATQQFQCPLVSWQTHQMARSVVDNTINQLLEDMGFYPSTNNQENVISFDVFPPVADNREGIENAAVLMAIQSHGLQKPCHCSHPYSPASSSPLQHVPFHHRPSTPLIPEPASLPADVSTPSTSEQQESQSEKSDFLAESIGETDFLAQAVAVAIQKKGLGSYSASELG